MAGNSNSGVQKICNVSAKDLETAFLAYRAKTEAGEIALPSLPHFLSGLPEYVGEDDLNKILASAELKQGTYKDSAKVVRRVLQWFRGQYLSNPAWGGHQSTKAVIALARDYGDGVTYSSKDAGRQGPEQLNVVFGDNEMSTKAGK